MMTFAADLGSVPVRGDVGVRYVKTEMEAYGYAPVNGVTKVVAENEYDDTLPSLNVVARTDRRSAVALRRLKGHVASGPRRSGARWCGQYRG